ncbi:hypothetical protein [Brevibacterium permense]|uniref:Uncharacterized protein n=1 Tax=Brevibacterium permense TaxID=234834 RepID=A0ABN2ACY4_9MICO|nr:hypothetical protein [Brevibacterium permense]
MDPSSERGPAPMFYPPLIGYLLLAVVCAVLAVSGWLLILGLFVRVWTTANRPARSADN